MPWLYAIVLGIVVGLAVGFIAERLPLHPLLRSIGRLRGDGPRCNLSRGGLVPEPERERQVGAPSVFMSDTRSVLFLLASCVFIAALHRVLGRFQVSAPTLARHRTVILGCLGGLCGALPTAWAMVVSTRAN